jgi:hypothetical protein
MLSVEDWAIKIAAEVSPAEVELAPIWAEAFIRGGKERKELFTHSNAQATGFTAGDFIALTPMIFQALAAAAPALLTILTSDMTGKFLDCVKNTFAVGEIFGKGKDLLRRDEGEKSSVSQAVYIQLNNIVKQLDQELRSLNLERAERAQVSLTVLRLLLENPPDATVFLEKLSEKK